MLQILLRSYLDDCMQINLISASFYNLGALGSAGDVKFAKNWVGKILFQIFILLKPKSLFTNPNSQLGTNQIKIKKRNNHINGYRNSFTLLCQLCMKIGVIATLSVGKRKLIITFNRNTIIAQEAAKLPKAKA